MEITKGKDLTWLQRIYSEGWKPDSNGHDCTVELMKVEVVVNSLETVILDGQVEPHQDNDPQQASCAITGLSDQNRIEISTSKHQLECIFCVAEQLVASLRQVTRIV